MNNLFHRDVYYIYRMLLRLGCLSHLGFMCETLAQHDMLTRQVCKIRNKHPLLHLFCLLWPCPPVLPGLTFDIPKHGRTAPLS